MKRVAFSLCLAFFLASSVQGRAQDGVAPGTVAAVARKASTSEWQNWIFAIGAMVSATAGILLVSWDPGSGVHHH